MLKINKLKGINEKKSQEERSMIYFKIVAYKYNICANLATGKKEKVWTGETTGWLRVLDALPDHSS